MLFLFFGSGIRGSPVSVMSGEDGDVDSDWFSDADTWFPCPVQLMATRSSHLSCESPDAISDSSTDNDSDDNILGDELSADEKASILTELKRMEEKELRLDPTWKPQCHTLIEQSLNLLALRLSH